MEIELATNLIKITLEIVGFMAIPLFFAILIAAILLTSRIGFKNAKNIWLSVLCVLAAGILAFAGLSLSNRCPTCNAYCTSTFCTVCGTQNGEQTVTCPGCGVIWGDDWQFCKDCGTPLDSEVAEGT